MGAVDQERHVRELQALAANDPDSLDAMDLLAEFGELAHAAAGVHGHQCGW